MAKRPWRPWTGRAMRTTLSNMNRDGRTSEVIAAVRKYVFGLDEPCDAGRDLLGGKGAGLAEMKQLGLPVPDAFTITTEACRAYRAAGCRLPAGLEEELDEHLTALELRTGKRFGDSRDPLLVSV